MFKYHLFSRIRWGLRLIVEEFVKNVVNLEGKEFLRGGTMRKLFTQMLLRRLGESFYKTQCWAV